MSATTSVGSATRLDRATRGRMASAAATLDERIAAAAERPAPSEDPGPEALRQLRTWRRLVAPEDPDHLARRLSWDGLTEAAAARALALDVHDGDGPLPEWTAFIAEVLEECGDIVDRVDPATRPEVVAPEEVEPPFVEVWLPFLEVCRRRLRRRLGDVHDLLGPDAHDRMASLLLRDLARQGAMAVDRRFRERVPEASELTAGDRGRYTRFVTDMLAGGLAEMLVELPVLARDLARVSVTWVDSTAELVERLGRDRRDIAEVFGVDPGSVTAVEPGLSDRHRGGRRTAILEFESGFRLVYKPRSVEMDRAFDGLLRWLGERGLESTPPRLRVLSRDGYGWVEEAAGGRLEGREAAERYFRAAGSLVCLAWVLRGQDLHVENLIATDRGPVIVDLEMLLQPVTADEGAGSSAGAPAPGADVATSCLGSGIVSFRQSDDDGEFRDQGGLSGTGSALSSTPRRRWRHPRTDAIRMEPEHEVRFEARNRPLLAGEPQAPGRWSAAVRAGFEATYRAIVEGRRELLAEDGPLAAFDDLPVRLLFRPSNQYGALLQVLASPRYQEEGAIRSCAVDSLNRIFAAAADRPLLWDLVALEREALERLDVPLFQVSSSGHRVNGSCDLSGYLRLSGLAAVRRRVEAMDLDDMEAQGELLEWALEGDPPLRLATRADTPASRRESDDGRPGAVDVAEEIAECLVRHGDRDADGEWSWPVPSILRRTPRGSVSGLAVYEGASGVALLFAALGRCRGDGWSELAGEVMAPVLGRLAAGDATSWLQEPGGLGAGTGLGSVLHAATLVAKLDGRADLLEPALATCRGLRADALPREPGHDDVLGGRAGLVLGLLSLHAATGEEAPLSLAARVGAQLRDTGESPETGGFAWRDDRGHSPGGFAHGAAGIGYALHRLAGVTGEEEYADLARDAFRHERSLYEPRRGNWRVPRPAEVTPGAGPPWIVGWCRGAPGAALARVLVDGHPEDPERMREVESALRTTRRHGRAGSDHLCCGNLGRADVLLTVGRRLERKELVGAARQLAGEVVAAAVRRGRFALRCSRFAARTFHHGFFQGLAGIGYQLLRTERPGILPSVLAFEPVPSMTSTEP